MGSGKNGLLGRSPTGTWPSRVVEGEAAQSREEQTLVVESGGGGRTLGTAGGRLHPRGRSCPLRPGPRAGTA